MPVTRDESTAERGSLPHVLDAHTSRLWAIALVFYGLGDTFTTLVGLHLGRAAEAGPVMATALDVAGTNGVLATKLLTVVGFFALWHVVPSPGRVGIPLALSVVGIVVTSWNLLVLLPV